MIRKTKLLAGMLMLTPSLGWCLQTIQVPNHEKLALHLSGMDYNRIFVKEDRILSVKGTIGQYQLESDGITGDVYIKSIHDEPFNLFITTEKKKTIQVEVHPEALAPETIELIIQEPAIKAPVISQDDWIRFSMAVGKGNAIVDAQVKEIKTSSYRPLHNGLHSKISRLIKNSRWQGEVYTLKNPTKKTMVLNSEDYYTPNTVSVSFSHQVIKPQQEVTLTKVVKHG